MAETLEERRAEALVELEDALEEIESGEGLSTFVEGHGIQSRVFEFEWSEPSLEISFRLPYARVLSDEESQKADEEEICAAIRMAILLMTVEGREAEGQRSKVEVSCDERGTAYAIYSADGELEDSGGDWAPLVRRLESELGDSSTEPLAIIWP